MFWGLIMEPHKRYTQVVKKDFHISMATLDISSGPSDEPSQIMCSYEDKNYLLCTLRHPDTIQCPLDLYFEVGTKISFAANGESRIHLTGYLTKDEELDMEEEEEDENEEQEQVNTNKKARLSATSVKEPPKKKIKTAEAAIENQQEEEDDDDESDDSDFDLDKLLDASDEEQSAEEEDAGEEVDDEEASDEEEEDESMDEEEESEDEEIEEEAMELPTTNGLGKKSKKNKEVVGTPKNEKQVKGKPIKQTPGPKSKKEENGTVETKQSKKQSKENQPQGSKKRTLPGGVIVEDIKEGSGDAASNGRFVHVYYEGRLKSNNKVFDKTQNGPGFGFRLGKGEVIKGWDLGVAGMKVGGKRRIMCPPHLAYGSKGSPPVIPPNATLIFEVELKKIK